ncbi:MAG: acyl-homoserine-lactone synthase [Celeribacter sp.]|jgi:acyl homoserine lactone synthase
MLRYLPADRLDAHPLLRDTMFRDRAAQFHTRLGWRVTVDPRGYERDAYDAAGPLYILWQASDGSHGGSLRLLPTTGRCMVNEHFRDVAGGAAIRSSGIWEVTRFCVSPRAGARDAARAAAALCLGAGEVMRLRGLQHFVAVFDPRMERIYRRLGLVPQVIGRRGTGRDSIGVGLFTMDAAAFAPILAQVGIGPETSATWLREAGLEAPVTPSRAA